MAGVRQSAQERVFARDGGKPPRILVVEARFYDELADELLAGAHAALKAAGCKVDVLTVPGALEIPATIVIALRAADERVEPYDAVVALGCVIRGETGHYDIVAGESSRALMDISVAYAMPVGNGILTVENMEQARARASRADMDKGGGAAEAALAVLAIKRAVS